MTKQTQELERKETERVMLPPPNIRRWVVSRKAQIVRAVELGVLSEQDACDRYRLSREELLSWRALVQQHGVHGLRVTKLKTYREDKAPASTPGERFGSVSNQSHPAG